MSRAGYDGNCDGWDLIRYRGAVASALRGRRGQAFLRDLVAALDAMSAKRLIAADLISCRNEMCSLGAVGARRGILLHKLDPDDVDGVAETFQLAPTLIREIMWVNDDEGPYNETAPARWRRVRGWATSHIVSKPTS